MEVKKEVDWNKVMAIRIAPSLFKAMELLSERPLCASELGKMLRVETQSASNYLHRLKRLNLVECITPERYNYRLYTLTEEGKGVFEKAKEYGSI